MDAPGSVGNAAAEMQRGRVMAWLAQLPGQLLLALAQPRAPRTAALGLAGGFPPSTAALGLAEGVCPPAQQRWGLQEGFPWVLLCAMGLSQLHQDQPGGPHTALHRTEQLHFLVLAHDLNVSMFRLQAFQS